MLTTAYGSREIGIDEVTQGARNSALVVGVFNEHNQQIGFARVILDKTRFAYILDVIIDEAYRQKGVGQAMMNYILTHTDMKTLYQCFLIKKDVHEFN